MSDIIWVVWGVGHEDPLSYHKTEEGAKLMALKISKDFRYDTKPAKVRRRQQPRFWYGQEMLRE